MRRTAGAWEQRGKYFVKFHGNGGRENAATSWQPLQTAIYLRYLALNPTVVRLCQNAFDVCVMHHACILQLITLVAPLAESVLLWKRTTAFLHEENVGHVIDE